MLRGLFMWLSFFLAVVLAVIAIFGPGYFALRTMRFDRPLAVCGAPLVSFCIVGLLGIVYGQLGVTCSPFTMIYLPITLLLAIFVIRQALGKTKGDKELSLGPSNTSLTFEMGPWTGMNPFTLALAIGLIMGLNVCSVVFVSSLGSPDAFTQNYDNAWHLWHIHSFAKSGNHSPLVGGFYPSLFHSYCALIQVALSVPSPVAENVMGFVLPALVHPACITLLLATIYPDKPRMVCLGSLMSLSIAFFPWRIMLFGPLYPNVMAFCIMSAEAASFMRMCEQNIDRRNRTPWIALFLIGGIALALTQPNAIFSTGVFLIPFCMYSVRTYVASKRGAKAGVIAELGFVAFVVVIWAVMLNIPFLHATIWYPRGIRGPMLQAIKWLAALCFIARRQQYLLGIIVFIGLAFMLRDKNRRWLVLSYLLMATLFVVAFSVDNDLKYILTGFWYSDCFRLAATLCVFVVPVIAYGVDVLVSGAVRAVQRHGKSDATESQTTNRSTALLLEIAIPLVIVVFNFFPLPFVPKAVRTFSFDTIMAELRSVNGNGDATWRYLGNEEIAFLKEVRKVVSQDDLIINQPYDGSVFAGSSFDIPVIYNSFGMGIGTDSKSIAIRKRLCDVAHDTEVQEALEQLGCRYLLMLDQGEHKTGDVERESVYYLGYDSKQWKGINAVRDDTEGFTVILSKDDMRLYRIDY